MMRESRLYQMMQGMNVWGVSPEEFARITTNYHLADAEAREALARLESAKKRVAEGAST